MQVFESDMIGDACPRCGGSMIEFGGEMRIYWKEEEHVYHCLDCQKPFFRLFKCSEIYYEE